MPVSTGIPQLDAGLAIAGSVWALLTTLATVLPKSWAFTQFCARFATDTRKIHTPEDPVK